MKWSLSIKTDLYICSHDSDRGFLLENYQTLSEKKYHYGNVK